MTMNEDDLNFSNTKILEIKGISIFYFDREEVIHIDTYSGKFYNGKIVGVQENYIIVNDRKIGEIPVAFSEIKLIDKFRGGE